jgi:glycosyltransferase involved in cell wall biosynthesis
MPCLAAQPHSRGTERVKILYILLVRYGQGTFWRGFNFSRLMARKGHSVTLMVTSPDQRGRLHVSEVEGVRVVQTPDLFRGPLRSGWDPWNTIRRILWLRGQEFDLVHSFESRPTVIYPALYLHRRWKVPLIMDWADWFGRGGSIEERPNPLVRAILRPVETYFEEHFRTQADGTTTICSLLSEKALRLGVPPERTIMLHNGSDPAWFGCLDRSAARQKVGLDEGKFIAGYVGTIFPRDARLMAAAYDHVAAQIPGFTLLINGYCPVDVRRLVSHPEGVIQTGPLTQELLNAYMAACDVFWLPLCNTNANRGRWPGKLNDYMAVGRPTVATAVGDVVPVFESSPIGLLSPDEPEAFAAQTLRLYSDQNLRVIMGQHARRLAETRYSWQSIVDELNAFYQKILSFSAH